MANLFGFGIKRKEDKKTEEVKSFAPAVDDEGSLVVSAGGAYGTYVDLEGNAKNEAELVTKYRNLVQQPEVQRAVEDIVNEAVVVTHSTTFLSSVTTTAVPKAVFNESLSAKATADNPQAQPSVSVASDVQ